MTLLPLPDYFRPTAFKSCILRSLLYEAQNKQEAFTWVLAARLSEPNEKDYGMSTFGLLPTVDNPKVDDRESIFRMPSQPLPVGMVVIERLPLTPETMWVKLLGKKEDCEAAYRMIRDSPLSLEKTATLGVCNKFNKYILSLTFEERTEEDMTIVTSTADVEHDYARDIAAWLAEGRIEEQQRMVKKVLVTKFGESIVTADLEAKLAQMNSEQLDALFVEAIGWNQPSQIHNYFIP